MSELHGPRARTLIPLMGAQGRYTSQTRFVLTQQYECDKTKLFTLMPADGAKHPDYPDLSHVRSMVQFQLFQKTAVITCTYESSKDPGSGSSDGAGLTYEISASVSSEPIDTHPDFVEFMGGTADDPLEGAIFDADGRFKGFAPDAHDDLGGVRTYFAPTATYREVSGSRIGASLFGIGFIGSPPGPVPSVPSGRNWLFSGVTQRKNGNNYTLTREYRLSGPRGWIPIIYA